jgi:hypothetical protein
MAELKETVTMQSDIKSEARIGENPRHEPDLKLDAIHEVRNAELNPQNLLTCSSL